MLSLVDMNYFSFCRNDSHATFFIGNINKGANKMQRPVEKITVLDDIIQVKLHKVHKNSVFIADIFNIIASKKVDIDMISEVMLEDEVDLEITCDIDSQKELNEALDIIRNKYEHIAITQNRMVSKVLVEGEGMRNTPGVAAGLFNIFAKLNVHILQVTTSLTSISYLINNEDLDKVVNAIKEEYQL